MKCADCPWYWKRTDDLFAHCQYPYEDGDAPCEWNGKVKELSWEDLI